jgi:hypothetical protein
MHKHGFGPVHCVDLLSRIPAIFSFIFRSIILFSMIFRSVTHFLGIFFNKKNKKGTNGPNRPYLAHGLWPNGHSARHGGLLRRPSPRTSGRPAQAEAQPRYAVCGHCAHGSCGSVAGAGTPAKEVRWGLCLQHQWRTGSASGKVMGGGAH